MIYLVAGMIIFWIATFVFVWSISRRQHKLEEEVAVLQEVVDRSAEATA
jgi:CcmD family protein